MDTRSKKDNPAIVAVVGASRNKDRYSNKAVRLLSDFGYKVIPVHPAHDSVEDIPAVPSLKAITEPVHTVTMYVNPSMALAYLDDILQLKPGRVIFNPGTESDKLESALRDEGIPSIRACTLVLLKTGQFEKSFS